MDIHSEHHTGLDFAHQKNNSSKIQLPRIFRTGTFLIPRWHLPALKGFSAAWGWRSEDVLIFGTDSLCGLRRQILPSFTLSLLVAEFQATEISLEWLHKRLEIIWDSWFTILCSQAREKLPQGGTLHVVRSVGKLELYILRILMHIAISLKSWLWNTFETLHHSSKTAYQETGVPAISF